MQMQESWSRDRGEVPFTFHLIRKSRVNTQTPERAPGISIHHSIKTGGLTLFYSSVSPTPRQGLAPDKCILYVDLIHRVFFLFSGLVVYS